MDFLSDIRLEEGGDLIDFDSLLATISASASHLEHEDAYEPDAAAAMAGAFTYPSTDARETLSSSGLGE